jgi:hypothetical protein
MIKKLCLFSLLMVNFSHGAILFEGNRKSAFSPYKTSRSSEEVEPMTPLHPQSLAFKDSLKQLPTTLSLKKLGFPEHMLHQHFRDAPKEEFCGIQELLSRIPPLARNPFKDFMWPLKSRQLSFMVRLTLLFKMSQYFVEIQTHHRQQNPYPYKSLFKEIICPCALHEQWKYRIFCNHLMERLYARPNSLRRLQFLGQILDQLKPIS